MGSENNTKNHLKHITGAGITRKTPRFLLQQLMNYFRSFVRCCNQRLGNWKAWVESEKERERMDQYFGCWRKCWALKFFQGFLAILPRAYSADMVFSKARIFPYSCQSIARTIKSIIIHTYRKKSIKRFSHFFDPRETFISIFENSFDQNK